MINNVPILPTTTFDDVSKILGKPSRAFVAERGKDFQTRFFVYDSLGIYFWINQKNGQLCTVVRIAGRRHGGHYPSKLFHGKCIINGLEIKGDTKPNQIVETGKVHQVMRDILRLGDLELLLEPSPYWWQKNELNLLILSFK